MIFEMKRALRNRIKKCEFGKDFNTLDVTNLCSKKDINAHLNPCIKVSKRYQKIRDLFSEEFESVNSYVVHFPIVEGNILYLHFNDADFKRLVEFVENNFKEC